MEKVKERRVVATIILMFASFMDITDSTIVNVALPAIQKSLGMTPTLLEWTLGGYMIAFATTLITGGRLGDIFGRQKVFLAGIAGFTLASLGAALAGSGEVLVIARLLQGAFAGIMVPQVLSSIQVLFSPKERGPIFGILGSIAALGAVSGLVLGGLLVTLNLFGTDWRSIFLINIPIGVGLFIASLKYVPNSKSEHPLKLDTKGVLLATASVLLVIIPLTAGHQYDWAWWIWAMLAAAPISLYVFIRQQKHKMHTDNSPLLPIKLFKSRGFSSGLVVQLASSIGNGGYAFILGLYLQLALHFTALQAGLTLLAIAAGSMVATPLAMTLAKRFGKSLIFTGGLIQAGAFIWAMQVIDSHGLMLSGWDLALPLATTGIGMLIMTMPLMDIALATIKPTEAGAASGTFSTFSQIGFALGIALAGVIYFNTIGTTPTAAVLQDATLRGLAVVVASYAAAALASLFMPRLVKKDAPENTAALDMSTATQ